MDATGSIVYGGTTAMFCVELLSSECLTATYTGGLHLIGENPQTPVKLRFWVPGRLQPVAPCKCKCPLGSLTPRTQGLRLCAGRDRGTHKTALPSGESQIFMA